MRPIAKKAGGAFTLRHADGCHYLFGWADKTLTRLSGRALRDHDFLRLWKPAERNIIRALLDDVRLNRHKKSISAGAFTMEGDVWPCFFDFAQLEHPGWHGSYTGCRWHAFGSPKFPDTPVIGLCLDNPDVTP